MANFVIQIDASRLDPKEWARRTGQTPEAIRKQMERGDLEYVMQGGKRMVNAARIMAHDLNSRFGR